MPEIQGSREEILKVINREITNGYSSRLIYFKMKNFASYENTSIDFDKDIIKIEGYNNAGKSAMLWAFAFLFINRDPNKQGKFIRDGCDFFRIEAGFSNGVRLVKKRYRTGQVENEFHTQKSVWTSREGGALAKQDIPEYFEKFLGMVNTPNAILNFRGRKDQLMMVDTSKSENYAAINEVLRTNELISAAQNINKDTNALLRDMNEKNATLTALKTQESLYLSMTEDGLRAVETIYEELTGINKRSVAVSEISSSAQGVAGESKKSGILPLVEGAYAGFSRVTDKTKKINTLSSLTSQAVSARKIASSEEVVKAASASLNTLDSQSASIDSMYTLLHLESSAANKAKIIESVAQTLKELRDVNKRESSLEGIQGIYSIADKASESYQNIGREVNKLEKEANAIAADIVASGGKLVKCPKCGNYICAD